MWMEGVPPSRRRRDVNHHMSDQGFDAAKLNKSSSNPTRFAVANNSSWPQMAARNQNPVAHPATPSAPFPKRIRSSISTWTQRKRLSSPAPGRANEHQAKEDAPSSGQRRRHTDRK